MTTSGPRRLHALVRGRVQGVGYRATTAAEALRRGLAGWVRNLSDGRVEVLAEGDEGVLRDFAAYLARGPRLAHVDSLDTEWSPAGGAPIPFEVRKTQ